MVMIIPRRAITPVPERRLCALASWIDGVSVLSTVWTAARDFERKDGYNASLDMLTT